MAVISPRSDQGCKKNTVPKSNWIHAGLSFVPDKITAHHISPFMQLKERKQPDPPDTVKNLLPIWQINPS